MRVCPKCNKKYNDYPAISRRDNKTEICPMCGIREALKDFVNAIKNKEEIEVKSEGTKIQSELDKLEQYLKENEIPYKRIDRDGTMPFSIDLHQIIVYDCYGTTGHRMWDAICHYGSYGYEEGLLEVMGDAVVRESDGDAVCGYLTAQDVIDRLEAIK